MGKYRRKPIVVDAVQWNQAGDHPAVRSLKGVSTMEEVGVIEAQPGRDKPLYNMIEVRPGDWIITDEEGNVSVSTPIIFEANYEPVEQAPEKPAKK